MYPTEKAFEQQYYSTKFSEKKNYDFQLWSAVDRTYIYLVKIYNDMLSTGIASTQNYIQDYFSVVQEDNVYKLNISGFVKNTVYGKVAEKDGISINVKSKDSYMDYEIYHIKVTNYSDSTILLDPISEDDTVYIRDDNDIIFNSMLIEMIEDDLLVKQGYTKDIDIKFVRSYTATTEVKTMKFTKIIKNYEKYLENKEKYEDFGVVKIDLK